MTETSSSDSEQHTSQDHLHADSSQAGRPEPSHSQASTSESPVPESVDAEQRVSSPSPKARLYWAAGLLSTWLFFLFVGATLGGAIHLALLGVLWLRPWQLSPEARS